MVAAWISAETGVGPSIASPSQACSGTCADLAQAPDSSSNPIHINALWLAPAAEPKTPEYDRVPKLAKITKIASASPASPTRFITKAFLAAVAAAGLWYQNPTSRKEARPTPSQPA